jgi:tetraacyldisaccharide 4'-kinase
MKTPEFWTKQGFLSVILQPLGKIYAAATARRLKSRIPYKAEYPVICIGNLTAGGTGKTPVSLSIAELLQNMGKNPYFISRGYGGSLHNVVVNPAVHTPQQVGDEPLLLAESAPAVINPDRAEAAKLAISAGADCLVMDDGFQNPTLFKDLSFLVFDGNYGIGNGQVIPAGPLREPFAEGIKRAQAVIILEDDKHSVAKQTDLPIFYGNIKEEQPKITNRNIVAFCGIGHPEKFFASLNKCGFNVVKTFNFPDHHFYTRAELSSLIEFAQKNNLDIYTTSKDFVKILPELRPHFKVLKIKISWHDEKAIQNFLARLF